MHHRAPGDIVAMTGLVRDIALSYPGQFSVSVATHYQAIWANNPHVANAYRYEGAPPGVDCLSLDYSGGISGADGQKHRTVHFLAYWHAVFNRHFQTQVKVHHPYPDLHISSAEAADPPVRGRYWVIVSGGKTDAPVKVWSGPYMQQVVDFLRAAGLGVVQIGSTGHSNWHHELTGVTNLIGKTNLREMIRVIAGAEGVICGVTAAMHMAAGLHKPCVVLGGGRESWWWEAYVNENRGFGPASGKLRVPHRYLHTIGHLECCQYHGCWKDVVVHTAESQRQNKNKCRKPVLQNGQLPLPLCMAIIKPEMVIDAIMTYYTDKSLPAIPFNPLGSQQSLPIVTAPVTASAPELKPAEPPPRPRRIDLFSDEPPRPKIIIAPRPEPLVRIDQTIIAKQASTPPRSPGTLMTNTADDPLAAVFDHPDVGGKFTVFVLLYGPEAHYKMHEECLQSLLRTTPPNRIDLRIGSNLLNARSVALVESLVAAGVVSKHYRNPGNDFKYPVMRRMFRDPDHPIKTKWVLWFDDDTICNRNPRWLSILSQSIIQHHVANNAHMFGSPAYHTTNEGQRAWYEKRPWHRGKRWRTPNGKPVPNGDSICFVAGSFWAITHKAIIDCDIPDNELGHNGGDFTIGEQLYQGGYNTAAFNSRKEYIFSSSVGRRGITTFFPGCGDTRQLSRDGRR